MTESIPRPHHKKGDNMLTTAQKQKLKEAIKEAYSDGYMDASLQMDRDMPDDAMLEKVILECLGENNDTSAAS